MAENREFTAEEIYRRTLHKRRSGILAHIQALRDDILVWEGELELLEKEIKEAENG